ncbi:MAG: hypothetical protein WBQ73_04050 [Candidatus Babeliales bacterium]
MKFNRTFCISIVLYSLFIVGPLAGASVLFQRMRRVNLLLHDRLTIPPLIQQIHVVIGCMKTVFPQAIVKNNYAAFYGLSGGIGAYLSYKTYLFYKSENKEACLCEKKEEASLDPEEIGEVLDNLQGFGRELYQYVALQNSGILSDIANLNTKMYEFCERGNPVGFSCDLSVIGKANKILTEPGDYYYFEVIAEVLSFMRRVSDCASKFIENREGMLNEVSQLFIALNALDDFLIDPTRNRSGTYDLTDATDTIWLRQSLNKREIKKFEKQIIEDLPLELCCAYGEVAYLLECQRAMLERVFLYQVSATEFLDWLNEFVFRFSKVLGSIVNSNEHKKWNKLKLQLNGAGYVSLPNSATDDRVTPYKERILAQVQARLDREVII